MRARRGLLAAVLAVLTALVAVALAGPAAAQAATNNEDSVLVRVNGDVDIASGDDQGVVVVVNGDLDLAAEADTVVVVDGTAELTGATVETLVVVSGEAVLGPGTVVTGDVRLVDTDLTRDASAVVEGSIDEGPGDEFFAGFWVLGILFMIGYAVLVVLAGLVLAAVAPDLARRAGRAITEDLGPTIVAGLILWIVLPIVGGLAFVTLIGVPIALAIWLVVLPMLGFVGFLVAGVRIGEAIVAREGGVGHPYLASLVGLILLIVIGAVPIIGPIVVALAGFLGSGALGLLAFRAVRRQPEGAEPVTPIPPQPVPPQPVPPEAVPPEPLPPQPVPPEPAPAAPAPTESAPSEPREAPPGS